MTDTVHVLAILTAKPSRRDDLVAAFNDIIEEVHSEDGCMRYELATDAPASGDRFGDDTVVVVEQWASMEALKAHGASAHMGRFRKASAELLTDTKVHILSPL